MLIAKPLVVVAGARSEIRRVKGKLEAIKPSIHLIILEDDGENELVVYVPPARYKGKEALIVLEQMVKKRAQAQA